MQIKQVTAESLRQQLSAPLDEMLERYEISSKTPEPGASSPPLLGDAFESLYDAIERTDASLGDEQTSSQANRASGKDVTELGEYALELFDQSLLWARQLDLDEVFDALQTACLDMAVWISARGGEIFTLEPVVDALARSANNAQNPGELLELYQLINQIMAVTASAIRQDLEKTNPGRPWRILLLNRAIVATRTHQPDIMEEAFQILGEYLPEEAPQFFSQGMEQMDLLKYPSSVREIMDRYYRKWSLNRSLH